MSDVNPTPSSARVARRYLLKQAAAEWRDVNPKTLTREALAQVWDMYQASYKTLGLKASGIGEMVSEYDHWSLAYSLEDDLVPVAFYMAKTTPFGLKGGFLGSDGSPDGKAAAKQVLLVTLKRPGYYLEVSHAVEHIAVKAGVPVVCAAYVPAVLHKDVEPSVDGLHYTRNLQGIGVLEKLLVGRPRGIPVTDIHHPECPLPEVGLRQGGDPEDDTLGDRDAHLACVLFDG